MKRCRLIAVLLLCPLLFSGCYDYRRMDKLNIIAGIALDKSEEEPGGYKLTIEVVNTAHISGEDNGSSSLYVETYGPSISEAILNSKKRLYSKLYFGGMRTIIISEEIARDDGMFAVIDNFLRDKEVRETVNIVISKEKTAGELLMVKGLDVKNVSYEIAEIVEQERKIDYTSKQMSLYKMYNALVAPGQELVLPAFRLTKNDNEPAAELDGLAVFSGDKLTGYLTAEESRYFLMLDEDKSGGAFSFYFDGSEISARIFDSKRKIAPYYDNGRLIVPLHMSVEIIMMETHGQYCDSDELREYATAVLCERVSETAAKLQSLPNGDIMALGNYIYRTNNRLWNELSENWPQVFSEADFQISADLRLINTGLISWRSRQGG